MRWSSAFRICDLGFSILSLVLSCTFDEAVVGSCEDLAEQYTEHFQDDVQSIDVCCWRDGSKSLPQ